jgi:hypothetical protein
VVTTLGAATAGTCEQAQAATLELADVTPVMTPAAPLRDGEQALIEVFEASTRSVVNIFDLSLQGRNVQAQVVCICESFSPQLLSTATGNNSHVSLTVCSRTS